MRYGVCDTSPSLTNRTGDIDAFWNGRRWRRRTTKNHIRAGLPGWCAPSVVEAKLSIDPVAYIMNVIAKYRAAGRLIDANIIKDQAIALELISRLNLKF